MLRKGGRRRSVMAEYRATRGVEAEPEVVVPVLDLDEDTEIEDGVRSFMASTAAAGMRLDAYLAQAIPEISRARVQMLIEAGQVRVDGAAAKSKQKMSGGEAIEIEGEPHPEPLHATAEEIPLDILYEDKFLAVVNKPAGMMVHAGAGSTDDARNRGTLVNALLFHMAKLSEAGGELRPGIVHRLDKQTSGAIVVAKDDATHRKLGEMFSARRVAKTYIALLHGTLKQDTVTVNLPIARGRAQCGVALHGGGADGDALRRVHAGGGADRDGTDAPDPGPCAVAGASCGGRYAVRRAARDSASSAEGWSAASNRGEHWAGAELSPCGASGVCPSSDGQDGGGGCSAARGVGGVFGAAEDGEGGCWVESLE
jgi:23S rRNA-/tRNA-specific pseudouridylate synthase